MRRCSRPCHFTADLGTHPGHTALFEAFVRGGMSATRETPSGPAKQHVSWRPFLWPFADLRRADTVLPSHFLRQPSQSAAREQRGDATVETSLAYLLLEQRLMGPRGQVLLDSADDSPLVCLIIICRGCTCRASLRIGRVATKQGPQSKMKQPRCKKAAKMLLVQQNRMGKSRVVTNAKN